MKTLPKSILTHLDTLAQVEPSRANRLRILADCIEALDECSTPQIDPEQLDKLTELREKYASLVWLARSSNRGSAVKAARKKVVEAYPEEYKALVDCDSNWTHGFNSGMLAALRLVLGIATAKDVAEDLSMTAEDEYGNPVQLTKEDVIRDAWEEFPMLDS